MSYLTIDAEKKYATHEDFIMAAEYQDFIEFLQNELGHDLAQELRDKFYAQQDSTHPTTSIKE